mmetsp:Transcript_14686/g.22643  ORF Transcript_14686/g.22643 Transcript_14686/m.22643 type:complete len:424 (-) Transcript_14686:1212-2483(-)
MLLLFSARQNYVRRNILKATFRAFGDSSNNTKEEIAKHAKQPQTSVSLQTLMQTGRGEFLHRTHKDLEDTISPERGATHKVLEQVAGFLRRELPIRLAHRIQELDDVPYMKEMPCVIEVKKLYTQSFLELVEMENKIMNPDQEESFARLVETIYNRHSKVLVQMARGAYEFRDAVRNGQFPELSKDKAAVGFSQMESTHEFLDEFYMCRIGIRVLIGQYLALRQPPMEHYIGIICSRTSPYEIVKRAIDDASFMCVRKYGDAPEVMITGKLEQTFPYVPTHLHYIMLELLKNSMRATVDWHGIDAMNFPPIKVVIADGDDNEDVVIKVSDEGGGIPRSNMKKIWSYLFTTADPAIQHGMVALNQADDHAIDSPLAGLGYGLPISRSYCRYFGGDLSIMSMEGHGTDAFVYLRRLGNTPEPVPV